MDVESSVVAEPSDFEQIARTAIERWGLEAALSADAVEWIVEELRQELREVWNARGAADLKAIFTSEPPCPTFSESELPRDGCKHCGWTEEAHDHAAAIKEQDR